MYVSLVLSMTSVCALMGQIIDEVFMLYSMFISLWRVVNLIKSLHDCKFWLSVNVVINDYRAFKDEIGRLRSIFPEVGYTWIEHF